MSTSNDGTGRRRPGGLSRRQFILGGGSVLGALSLAAAGELGVNALASRSTAINSFSSVPPAPAPRFQSRPDLRIPGLAVDFDSGATAPGSIFISPYGSPHGQEGPVILDNDGAPIWQQPVDLEVNNFRLQTYRGQPVLTWWQGRIEQGHGVGSYVIANTAYEPIAHVQAGNGLRGDLHEFLITSRDTALLTAYVIVPADLRSVGGPREGTIQDAIFQELDIATGRVLLEWHSLDHIALAESYWPTGKAWDYVHLNSVDVDADDDGNLLVSSRNTHTLYKVDRASGEIIWRLGGKRSDFAIGAGAAFADQHDARSHPGGLVTMFDNEGSPFAAGTQSRGLALLVDETHRTAKLRTEYRHPLALQASSKGSVQLLPNGNVFVGWGAEPFVSEFSSDGRLLFDARIGEGYIFYRAFRFPWDAVGQGSPAIAARRSGAARTDLWVSWNGDTQVQRWLVLSGGAGGALSPAGIYRPSGFETAIALDGSPQRLAVRGLDSRGRTLGQSATLTV
jgi:Arylsulfotransferase (ASST)